MQSEEKGGKMFQNVFGLDKFKKISVVLHQKEQLHDPMLLHNVIKLQVLFCLFLLRDL